MYLQAFEEKIRKISLRGEKNILGSGVKRKLSRF